ncbi:MFS transporter [Pseudoduganella aquatica]|uniref:MFS transporter n=1 Tax=Pseudoduganella aquatica TaxID=2660641 RepID=A0A7X4H7M9_9BURK|nr:MFS transporter [Pseudoduganella aquatica]MYN06213.1 MFS transporter [Pseudoduganella aquatica]
MPQRWKTLAILACTQIMSWGALYYAIAILAPEIQREMGWRGEAVVGAFSWSLLVSGLAATPIGALLDRHGGRGVMGAGSLLGAAGFALLSQVHSLPAYYAAWTVLGCAMAMTMYEAAFATINRQFGMDSRKAISTLTLFGGFASTVSWPLTQYLDAHAGWRATCLVYAAAQLLLSFPLHLLLPSGKQLPPHAAAAPAAPSATGAREHSLQEALRHPAFWKLAFAFSANSFIFSALSVHLIPLLQQYGHAATLAVWLAALVGPMQVAGRIGEMTIGRHALPRTIGKITFCSLPAALLALLLFGHHAWAAALFCMMYGMSNGILTIVRGTIPQTMFGRRHYGAISGALAGPALIARAAGPLAVAGLVRYAAPAILLLVLLAAALASLAFYLLAIRAQSQRE